MIEEDQSSLMHKTPPVLRNSSLNLNSSKLTRQTQLVQAMLFLDRLLLHLSQHLCVHSADGLQHDCSLEDEADDDEVEQARDGEGESPEHLVPVSVKDG